MEFCQSEKVGTLRIAILCFYRNINQFVNLYSYNLQFNTVLLCPSQVQM